MKAWKKLLALLLALMMVLSMVACDKDDEDDDDDKKSSSSSKKDDDDDDEDEDDEDDNEDKDDEDEDKDDEDEDPDDDEDPDEDDNSGNAVVRPLPGGDDSDDPDEDNDEDNDVPADAPDADAEAAVAEWISENGESFMADFESGFESSGLTCDSMIKAHGTGFLLAVRINELEDFTDAQKADLQATYDAQAEYWESLLGQLQADESNLTYFVMYICDCNGEALATITAGDVPAGLV